MGSSGKQWLQGENWSRHLLPHLLVLAISGLISPVASIRCFECGLYIPPDQPHLLPGQSSGKIYPCVNSTQWELRECKESQPFCMKYVNTGLVVHSCAETCVEDISSYSEREIHCCNDDACNGGFAPRASLAVVASLLVITLVNLLHLTVFPPAAVAAATRFA